MLAEEMAAKIHKAINDAKPPHVQQHSITTRLERARTTATTLETKLASVTKEVEEARKMLEERLKSARESLVEAQRQ
eukprot:6317654-Pyramimonas_sp.AAC.1